MEEVSYGYEASNNSDGLDEITTQATMSKSETLEPLDCFKYV